MPDDEISNEDRAARASEVVYEYSNKPDMVPVENAGLKTTLSDLLADMMHLADQERVPWEDVQGTAEMHFNAEKDEETPSGSRKDWDPRRG